MSHKKGSRQRVVLRLPDSLVANLKAYRIARGLDGLPAVVEELHALRQDRDATLQAALDDARRLTAERDAALALANEKAREAKRANSMVRKQRVRGAAQRALPRPIPEPFLPQEALDGAMRTKCTTCDCFMDPVGFMAGQVRCIDCRRLALPAPS